MQHVVKKVLPREEFEKYVIESALMEANSLMSSFRTEERRRVSIFAYYPFPAHKNQLKEAEVLY